MEVKDIILIVSVLFSIFIGLFNIWLQIRNQNSLYREYVYKEQIKALYGLFNKINSLNVETDYLINSFGKKIEVNKIDNCQKEVQLFIQIHSFILPNRIIELSNLLLQKNRIFIQDSVNVNSTNELNSVNDYYKVYFELISQVRNYYGIEKLAKENFEFYLKKI